MSDKEWKKLIMELDSIRNSIRLSNRLKALKYINEEILDSEEKSVIASDIFKREGGILPKHNEDDS